MAIRPAGEAPAAARGRRAARSGPGAASGNSPGQDGHDPRQCDAALARAFDFLGKRWNGIILATLGQGPAGFAEIRRAAGAITDSVLSDRLAELTAAGLISREVTDARPPGVSYALTAAGLALLPVLNQLSEWAACNLDPAANTKPRC